MTPYRSLFLIALLFVAACTSAQPPMAPAPVKTPDPSLVTYAINVPDAHLANQLQAQFPDGIPLSPMSAQAQWDYTATYGGSPNVYFGESAPWQGYDCAGKPINLAEYMNTGIVVAPRAVAASTTFTARDWPNIGLTPGVTYAWLGRFTYARPETFAQAGAATCPK